MGRRLPFVPRRRRFLVLRHVQIPVVLMSVLHVVAFACLLAAALFAPLMVRVDGDGSRAAAESATQLLYLHERFWWMAGIGLVVVALDAIRVSHRFSGPLYRMTKSMREAAAGRIPAPIRLRKGDHLHREVAVLNELFAYAADLRGELRQALERLDRALADVADPSEAEGVDAAARADALRDRRRQVAAILARLEEPRDEPVDAAAEVRP